MTTKYRRKLPTDSAESNGAPCGGMMAFASAQKSLRVIALSLAAACIFPTIASATKSATIRNIPPTPHFAPPGTPLVDLGAAIKTAAALANWQIMGESPGAMTASLSVRNHEAIVIIRYDESNYQIDYHDSSNLNFRTSDLRIAGRGRRVIKGPRIHKNYNVWVGNLAKKIGIAMRHPPRADSPKADSPQAAPADARDIVDELEQLDALRQRGVLTREEFDQLKAQLLKR